jgi:signal transduction histidine kinase
MEGRKQVEAAHRQLRAATGRGKGGSMGGTDDERQRSEQFLAIVSHEMRTPVTSIISFSELIRGEAEGLSPDGWRYLDIIERNAERLLHLITDLLMLARIESGGLPLDIAPVDVPRLVADAVLVSTPLAAKHDITIHTDAREGPMLMGDQRRLLHVLDNLLGNAVKFSRPGGLIRVTARFHATRGPAGGSWRIAVSDSGIGIPPGEVEHLFDRFTRGSNARTAQLPGSGLGLSIVKLLTEMHGGHIRVHSVLDTGTTFSVFLPVAGPAGALPALGGDEDTRPASASEEVS